MRCKNCGWENPDLSRECEKCGSPLVSETPTPCSPEQNNSLKGTVAESAIFGEKKEAAASCPKCGYPIAPNMNSCPNCGNKTEVEMSSPVCKYCGEKIPAASKYCPSCGKKIEDETPTAMPRAIGRGTVIGGPVFASEFNNFCSLKPIAWKGEEAQYNPITYSGEEIILTRSNTDANNNSITSKEQAILTYEDGDWYIENRSELRSTYIRVGSKIKLKSGDIIIMGNREFEFKAK